MTGLEAAQIRIVGVQGVGDSDRIARPMRKVVFRVVPCWIAEHEVLEHFGSKRGLQSRRLTAGVTQQTVVDAGDPLMPSLRIALSVEWLARINHLSRTFGGCIDRGHRMTLGARQ